MKSDLLHSPPRTPGLAALAPSTVSLLPRVGSPLVGLEQAGHGPRVAHVVHHPVGAKGFIEPVVAYLAEHGIPCELWLEAVPGTEEFLNALQVEFTITGCDLRPDPRAIISTLRELRRRIRERKPEIVHCHQSRCSLLPLMAARQEKVPVRVYHNHGLSYVARRGLQRALRKQVDWLNCRLATHVLFVSHSTLECARRDGLLGVKPGLVVGPGTIAGVDLSRFPTGEPLQQLRSETRRRLGLEENVLVVGYVGRPVAHKGFPLMLEGWQRSSLSRTGGCLLMAGCKPEHVVHTAGSELAGVRALGYQANMVAFYSACDLVALPSQTEGFAYSLLEGAAAGRPLLATDVPGNSDAIQSQENGLLIPPNDAAALARALDRLQADSALRLRLGENARRIVTEKYAREKVLAALLDYYRRELLPRLQRPISIP